MTNTEKEFLKKLADLCDTYEASFDYSNDDDGIHIYLASGEDIFVGFLSDGAAKELRSRLR